MIGIILFALLLNLGLIVRTRSCSGLTSEGLILDFFDPNNATQSGFQVNSPIKLHIFHTQIPDDQPLATDPRDYVGIYHVDSVIGSRALVFDVVPFSSREISFQVPSQPGAYVFRYTSWNSLQSIAESNIFTVRKRKPYFR
jgi:hypothetical protein